MICFQSKKAGESDVENISLCEGQAVIEFWTKIRYVCVGVVNPVFALHNRVSPAVTKARENPTRSLKPHIHAVNTRQQRDWARQA